MIGTEDQVLCPICDFVLERPEIEYRTMAGVAVPTPKSLKALTEVAKDMETHVEGHATAEWIQAFDQADIYIAQLEREIAGLTQERDHYKTQLEAAVEQRAQERERQARAPRFAEPVFDDEPGPRRKQRHVDPDQTLIPIIPQEKRPAGVVGRRTA